MTDPTPEQIAAIDARRQRMHERLQQDRDYLEFEIEGRLAQIVDDCLNEMRKATDPVKLYALKERWLLAEENHHHHAKTLAAYRADALNKAQAAAREVAGLPPADAHE